MGQSTTRKLLRSSCHAAALFNWTVLILGVPIAVLIVSDDPLVRDSAKEALNFTFSMWLWGALSIGIMFTLIGIPAGIFGLFLFGAVSAIFPIIAIISVCVAPEKPYRYPFTFRFFPTSNDVSSIAKNS